MSTKVANPIRSWNVRPLESEVDHQEKHQAIEHPGSKAEEINETANVGGDHHQKANEALKTNVVCMQVFYIMDHSNQYYLGCICCMTKN